jgi:hypothetical protein
MDYTKHGIYSLKGLIKNPVLFIPDFIMYVITYIATIFFYKSSNLDILLEQFILGQAIKLDAIIDYLATNSFHFFVSGSIFILLTFFLGVGIDILRFRLIKRFILKQKLNLIKEFFGKKPYYLKLVFLKVYVYVLTLFMLVISTAIILMNNQIDNDIIGVLLKVVGLFFGIAIIFFIKSAIMYRHAILFLGEEKHAYKVLTRSLKLFLRNTWPVVTIWLIIISVGLGVWVLMSTIGLIANQIQPFLSSVNMVYILSAVATLLVYLIKLSYNLWEHMFLFSTYEPIKKSS